MMIRNRKVKVWGARMTALAMAISASGGALAVPPSDLPVASDDVGIALYKTAIAMDSTDVASYYYDTTTNNYIYVVVKDEQYAKDGVTDTKIKLRFESNGEFAAESGGVDSYTATTPAPGAGTYTTGALVIEDVTESAQDESWNLVVTDVNDQNHITFSVTGSVSGAMADAVLIEDALYYSPDNAQFVMKITRGDTANGYDFEAGDNFSFETIAGGDFGKVMTLTELSDDRGLFISDSTGTAMPFIFSGTPGDATGTAGDSVLSFNTYDTLSVHYVDDNEEIMTDPDTGNPVSISVPFAPIVAVGTLGTATWSDHALVLGDVVVPHGETLNTTDDKQVRFSAGSDASDSPLGSHSGLSELIVQGTLTDGGATFTTTNQENPQLGDWGGISLVGSTDSTDSSATLTMTGSTVEYAKGYGIKLKAGKNDEVDLESVTIQNNDGHGIYSVGDYQFESATDSIHIKGSTKITNNRASAETIASGVMGDADMAYAIYQSEHGWDHWKIEGTTKITNSDQDGDGEYDGGGVYLKNSGDVRFTSVTVKNNRTGVDLIPFAASAIDATGTTIESNGTGLSINLNKSSENLSITSNTITKNDNGNGITLVYERGASATDDMTVTGNTISIHEGYGLYATSPTVDSSSTLVINSNIFIDNALGAIYMGQQADASGSLTSNHFVATTDPLNSNGNISQRYAVVNATTSDLDTSDSYYSEDVFNKLEAASEADKQAIADSLLRKSWLSGKVDASGTYDYASSRSSEGAPSAGSATITLGDGAAGQPTELSEDKVVNVSIKLSDIYSTDDANKNVTYVRLVFEYDDDRLTLGTLEHTLPADWFAHPVVDAPSIFDLGGDNVRRTLVLEGTTKLTADTTFQLPVQLVAGSSDALDATGTWITLDSTDTVAANSAGTMLTSKDLGHFKKVREIEFTYTDTFKDGWNLFGLPMVLDTDTTDSAEYLKIFIQDLNDGTDSLTSTKVHSIWAEDPELEGGWLSYNTAIPAFLNSLKTLDPNVGYWVNLDGDATDTGLKTWKGDKATAKTAADMKAGYNLVVAVEAQQDATAIQNYLTEMGASIAWGWDNSNGGKWQSYNVAVPSFLNTLSTMDQGKAYYLYVENGGDAGAAVEGG